MVILNHNDTADTLRLVSSIAGAEIPGFILIADNSGGIDPEILNLESEKVKVAVVKNNGYARGNNAAVRIIEETRGPQDYIIISNPDVMVSPGSIKTCVEFLRNHSEYAVAAPRMFGPGGSPHSISGWKERGFKCDLAYSSGLLSRLIGMYRETYPESHWQTPYSDVDCVAGSFFVIREEALKKAGGFDENTFLYYEEDILGYKLKRLGFKSAVINTEKFVHYEGVSVGRSADILKKYVYMQRSRLYFQKHYRKIGAFKYLVLCAATALGFLEKSLKRMLQNGLRKDDNL